MPKMLLVTDLPAFLAQTAAPAGTGSGSQGMPLMIVFYGLMIAGFYFLMIAPQRKKDKEAKKMLAALSSGDEVLMSNGIYGTITNVKEDRFVVRIADNTKVEVAKAFIASVVSKSDAEKK